MVHYKLIYFDLYARGEFIRMVRVNNGIFEIIKRLRFLPLLGNNSRMFASREKIGQLWKRVRFYSFFFLQFLTIQYFIGAEYTASQLLEMPFGQIPVLEIDGKPLAQSYTIGRYLARQFGSYIFCKLNQIRSNFRY